MLLDPTTAVPRVITDGVLSSTCALMIGMDATGYEPGPDGLRVSRVVEGVDARRVRAVGGDVAKLNVYMRPDREGLDSHPARLIASTVEDCAREDVLLVIEILTYALPDESPSDVLDLAGRFQLTPIALRRGANVIVNPHRDEMVNADDQLTLIGRDDHLERLGD